MMLVWGAHGTFGIFLNQLTNEFGWLSAVTAGAFSFSMVVHGFSSVVIGALNDKVGPRIILSVTAIITGSGFLLLSQVNHVWQLYVFYGLMVGIGITGAWVPLLSTIAKWFQKNRSFMSGVILTGFSLGGFLFPLFANYLINKSDWRSALIAIGIMISAIVLIAAQFLRSHPPGDRPSGGLDSHAGEMNVRHYKLSEAVRDSQFWRLFLMLALLGFCVFSIIVHIVPYATDLSYSDTQAASVLSAMWFSSLAGRIVLGSAGDRIGNRNVFLVSWVLMAIALSMMLLLADNIGLLYIAAAIFGFTYGGCGAIESPFVASLFGLRSHGAIYGALTLGFTIGASLGPFISGYTFDLFGNYRVILVMLIVFCVLGFAIVRLIKLPKPGSIADLIDTR